MMKKSIIIIGIFFSILILTNILADEIRMPTGNEIIPLQRGDNMGYLPNPGINYSVYYIADGKSAVFQYSQNFFIYYFLCKSPVVAMNIYYATDFNKNFILIKKAGIDIFSQKTALSICSGVYRFEYKLYGECASLNFRVY